MTNVRLLARSMARGAGLWLLLTAAACDSSPLIHSPTSTSTSTSTSARAPATATTTADAQALAQALAAQLGPPAGGYKTERDRRGNVVIQTGQRLGNVTVMGRGADGVAITGCVSDPAQVPALFGQGR